MSFIDRNNLHAQLDKHLDLFYKTHDEIDVKNYRCYFEFKPMVRRSDSKLWRKDITRLDTLEKPFRPNVEVVSRRTVLGNTVDVDIKESEIKASLNLNNTESHIVIENRLMKYSEIYTLLITCSLLFISGKMDQLGTICKKMLDYQKWIERCQFDACMREVFLKDKEDAILKGLGISKIDGVIDSHNKDACVQTDNNQPGKIMKLTKNTQNVKNMSNSDKVQHIEKIINSNIPVFKAIGYDVDNIWGPQEVHIYYESLGSDHSDYG